MDTKIGTLIDETAQRDAIHIAIAPVLVHNEFCDPGEHVGFLTNGNVSTTANKKIGIIDPFLKDPVRKGQRCYLFLYPQTVTGMKHHWSHPDFPDKNDQRPHVPNSKSEQWLRDFAANAEGMGLPYDELMSAAKEFVNSGGMGGGYCFGSDMNYSTNWPEFWTHFEAVTGLSGEGGFFRCAC
jgi:hypothetical protein